MSWTPKKKTVSGNQIIDSSISFDNLGCTIDEDNMASDSATHVPTQQSVKAYVDANGGGSSQWTTTGSDIYYNTGFVGIGTTTPSSPLHIHTDDPDFIQEMDSTATANLIQHNFNVDGVTEGALLYDKANELFELRTTKELKFGAGNNAERMRIDASGNVGIGTSSPDSKLHVSSTDSVSITQTHTDGNTVSFKQSGTGGDVEWRNGNGEALILTGSQTRMLIDSSGNVGIGTTSPDQKLDINNGSLRLETTGSQYVFASDTGAVKAGHRYHAGNNFVATYTASTERMRIDSSGKVGINTTSPDNTLDVEATQDTVANILSNGSYAAKFSSSTTGDAGRTQGILLSGVNANTRGVALLAEAQSTNNAHDFVIATSDASSTPTESMRISANGNVGIGNTNPFHVLDIDSGIANVSARCQTSTTGALIAFKDATATSVTIPAAVGGIGNELSFVTNNTEKVRIDDSGNVGIGTTDPAFKLSIATPAIPTNSTYQWTLDLSRANDTARGLSFGIASAGTTTAIAAHNADVGIGHTFGVDANNLPQYYETLTVKHTDESVGKVGIGTTSPAKLLHIKDGDVRIESTFPRLYLTDTDNNSDYSIINNNGEFGIYDDTNATYRLRISADGKAAIGGAVDATVDLLVHGETVTDRLGVGGNNIGGYNIESHTSDAIHALFKSSSTTSSYIYFRDGNSTQDSAAGFGAKGDECSIVANGQERVRIDSDGKVGIGTNSPSRTLHIKDSVAGIRLEDSDGTSYGEIVYNEGSNGLLIRSDENNADLGSNIIFEVDGSESARIDSSGNVGIGTTSPTFDSGYNGLHISQTAPSIHLTPTGAGTTASDGYAINVNSAGIVRHINKENQPIEFHTNNTERLRIDSAGNVGIGVTDPSVELDVSGTIRATTRLNIGNSNQVTALSLYSGSVATTGTFESNATGAYIIFKDATSGGSNVGIGAVGDDCFIMAGGSEKVRIDDSGNVGIGTNAPTEKLDVQGNITATGVVKLDGGLATAPAYTFDGDTNTGMYSPAADTLAFTEGGGEKMRINSAGKVLIGTTSQGSYGAKLRVLGGRIEASGYVATGNSSLFLLGGNYGAPTIECRSYTSYSSSTQKIMRFAGSTGTERGSITIAGVTTSYNTSSDERLKENISDAEDAGSKIDAIRIRQFDWKDGGEHQDYGVIAQELQSVAPEAVSEGYDEEDMWSVDYSKLVPTLIKEIQTLRNRVAQLENNE